MFSQRQKTFSSLGTQSAKRFVVKGKGEVGTAKEISLSGRQALAERVQRAHVELEQRRGKISYRQIAERSGGLISEGAITNLLARRVGNPSALTLYGLARALEIHPFELFSAALGISEPPRFRETRFWDAYEAYNRLLDDRDKQTIEREIQHVCSLANTFSRSNNSEDHREDRALK